MRARLTPFETRMKSFEKKISDKWCQSAVLWNLHAQMHKCAVMNTVESGEKRYSHHLNLTKTSYDK
jgi:hypothetical protein